MQLITHKWIINTEFGTWMLDIAKKKRLNGGVSFEIMLQSESRKPVILRRVLIRVLSALNTLLNFEL